MKKMIALLLVVCVMCSMLIVTASAAEPRSMMRVETVTKRAANVRKYPNTNSLVYNVVITGQHHLKSDRGTQPNFQRLN